MQQLVAADANPGTRFGTALEGDTLIVGAPGNNDAGNGTGAVYLYERGLGGPGQWGFVRKLHASDLDNLDRYGSSIALSGDRAVIGAPEAEDPPGAGKAYVLARNPGGNPPWIEVKILTAGNGAIYFGGSVGIDGDLIGVSTSQECSATLFRRDQGGPENWGLVTRVRTTIGYCGWVTVRVLADRVALGDFYCFTAAGAVFLFERDHGGADQWGLGQRIDAPPSPYDLTTFGGHLATDADEFFSGANFAPDDVHAFHVDLTVSRRYCTSSPNSVGAGAFLGVTGSTHVSHDNLVLVATGGPPGQFGLFYYGPTEVALPFGNGLRCVGGGALGLFRLNPPEQIDTDGVAQRALDYDAPPSPAGQITPGSTWNLQFWYSDPAAGGADFNLSDAFALQFCP